MSFFPYSFEGPIARHDLGRYAYVVVYLPEAVKRQLPLVGAAPLRITGEVADRPIEGAWQPGGEGRFYLILSKRFLREAELSVGDVVDVRFALADPNAVSIPDALGEALRKRARLRAAWAKLTPGAQRAFAHRVASDKAPATVLRRVQEVSAMILDGVKPGRPRLKSARKIVSPKRT